MADIETLKTLMEGMRELYGVEKQISAQLAKMYWEDLKEFSNEDLEAMFRAHRRDPDRGRFFPKPADLLAKAAKAGPKHLAADAAWSIALQSFDEKSSVVWTPEIGRAVAVALPVWNSGDRIGSRMAFKAAYDAILASLPAVSIPKWQVSLGHSPQARLEAVEKAQAMGIINKKQADILLPHYLKPASPEVSAAVKMLAKPMNGEAQVIDMNSTQESPKSVFLKRWREMLADAAVRARAREELEQQEKAAARASEAAARKVSLQRAEYKIAQIEQAKAQALIDAGKKQDAA